MFEGLVLKKINEVKPDELVAINNITGHPISLQTLDSNNYKITSDVITKNHGNNTSVSYGGTTWLYSGDTKVFVMRMNDKENLDILFKDYSKIKTGEYLPILLGLKDGDGNPLNTFVKVVDKDDSSQKLICEAGLGLRVKVDLYERKTKVLVTTKKFLKKINLNHIRFQRYKGK